MRKLLSIVLVLCAVITTSGCPDQGGGEPIKPPVIPPPTTKNADPLRNAFVPTADPYNETVTKVEYLPQNWNATESLTFYFTPQGSQLIPYDWFLALEQPGASTTLFRDNQNILKYRYLPQNPDSWNPDGLPVGFTGETADKVNWLGMTCAACHTAELHVNNVAYRVDGAPTQANVQALISDMIVAVKNTVDDPAKFDRFAAKVLAGQNDSAGQADLKAKIAKWLAIRSGYNRRNFPGYRLERNLPAGPARCRPVRSTRRRRSDHQRGLLERSETPGPQQPHLCLQDRRRSRELSLYLERSPAGQGPVAGNRPE